MEWVSLATAVVSCGVAILNLCTQRSSERTTNSLNGNTTNALKLASDTAKATSLSLRDTTKALVTRLGVLETTAVTIDGKLDRILDKV